MGKLIYYNLHGLTIESNSEKLFSKSYLTEKHISTPDIQVFLGKFDPFKKINQGEKPLMWASRLLLQNLHSKPVKIFYRPYFGRRVGRRFRKLLWEIIKMKFLENNFTLMHSACVTHNGKGILIIAPAETGKTITVLKLLKKGFNFLSDDYILTNGKKAYPIPSGMTFHSLHAQELNLNFLKKLEIKIRDKILLIPILSILISEYKLPPQELPNYIENVKIIKEANIHVLIFLERGNPSVEKLDKGEALKRLKVIGNVHIPLFTEEILLEYSYYYGYPDFDRLRMIEYSIYERLVNSCEKIYLVKSFKKDYWRYILDMI